MIGLTKYTTVAEGKTVIIHHKYIAALLFIFGF